MARESAVQAQEYHETVAKNIKRMAEARGKTAKDVYTYLGMSKSKWSAIMRTPGKIDLEFVSGVARYLNVRTVDLLTKEYKLVEIGGEP